MDGRRAPLYGYLTGYFISQAGTAMSGVAIPWLVLVTTGSAGRTGAAGFAEMAPFVLVQATAGPLADRLGHRRASAIGNAAAAVFVGAVPVLHWADRLPFAALLALVALGGAVRGLADAASNPLVPTLARSAGLPMERAAGIFSAANRTGLLVGIPLGGFLIAAIGAANVLLVDAVSFACCALTVAVAIPHHLVRPTGDEPLSVRGYGRQLREGLQWLRADRLMLALVSMIFVTNMLDQALMSVLLPVWVRTRLHTATGLGLLGGLLGGGLLIGVLLGSWITPRLPRRATLAGAFLLCSSPPFFALAGSSTLPVVAAVFFVAGVLGGVLNPIIGGFQYSRVPEAMQARVFGTAKATAWAGIPIGSVVGGALASAVGLTTALICCGAIMLAATLPPSVFPVWRGLDRSAPSPMVPV